MYEFYFKFHASSCVYLIVLNEIWQLLNVYFNVEPRSSQTSKNYKKVFQLKKKKSFSFTTFDEKRKNYLLYKQTLLNFQMILLWFSMEWIFQIAVKKKNKKN